MYLIWVDENEEVVHTNCQHEEGHHLQDNEGVHDSNVAE